MKQKSTELKGEIDNTMIVDTDLISKGGAAWLHLQDKWVWEAIPWARAGLWALGSGDTSQEEAGRAKQ